MTISIKNKIQIKKLFSGIGRKFLLYFIFFSIIPLTFISILGYNISENLVIKQNIRYLQLQNETLINRLSNFFAEVEADLSPENPENQSVYQWVGQLLEKPLPRECEEATDVKFFLENKVENSHALFALGLVGTNSRIYCETDSAYLNWPPIFIEQILRSDNSVLFRFPTNQGDQNLILVKTPLSDDNRQNKAFILGILRDHRINQILRNFSNTKQISQVYILGPNFKPIFSTGNLPEPSARNNSSNFTVEDNFVTRWDGEKVLRSFQEFPLLNWTIVSEVTYEVAMADIIVFRNQVVLGVGILLILLVGLAFYFSQRISVPIRQLAYAAQDIGEGLLDAPIRIETGDEIGVLANEFDDMRKKLLDYYENLENKVQARSEELKQAQFQIMHQEKMASIGLLAAGIAHEIGNPLTSISSLTQLLKRRLKDETNSNYLSTIMKNIDRISRIVRELVDFSRPSHHELALTNINDVVQAAVGIVKYDSRAKHIDFDLDFSNELPPIVLVADQLLQVCINILFNAVDAMEGHGTDLQVRTFLSDKCACIQIQDSGVGIPESEIHKIFEPFYTTKEIGKGTGLGLSVSYGIIRNFNGDITVESKIDHGTKFTIKLPKEKTSGDLKS